MVDELITTAAIRKQGFGGLWHLINHAAGLVELHHPGYPALAAAGLPAHHYHIRLWRSLPDVEAEPGPVEKADQSPFTTAYWDGIFKRDEARLTHRIKTLYGFSRLLPFVENNELQAKALDAFLYLMA